MSQNPTGSHENFARHEKVVGSSNRSFGVVFCVFFAILAAIQLYVEHLQVALVLAGFSAGFLVVSLAAPKLLAPLNAVWMKIGLLLHSIVNPIVLGAIFFVVCTPMGLVMRMVSSDPLRRKMDPDADSYWIDREEPGPRPETMINQF